MVPVGLRRWLVDPRRRVAVSLSAVWLISAWHYGGNEFLWWPALCALVALMTETAWHFAADRRFIFNYSSIITGLLIGLVMYPVTSGYLGLVLPAGSIVLKRLLYPRERPLANPAALAMVLANVLWDTPISWWGVAWSPWLGLALALSVFDVLWKLKLWVVPVAFLVSYAAYLSSVSGFTSAWPLVFDGTALAFAFVMLPEPKSGPQGLPLVAKVGFALAVVGVIVLLGRLLTFTLDPLLTALLITSLLFALSRFFRVRAQVAA